MRIPLRLIFAAAITGSLWAAADFYRIDTVAGSDWVGDGGSPTAALLFQADGIAADSSGNLYVSDAQSHRVRKIGRDGVIVTIAGNGSAGFSGDGGPAAAAQLNAPYGLAVDGVGNLYLADLGNARVRRIGIDGTIATVAGGGTLAPGGANEGLAATGVALSAPRNLAWDGRGSLYISDFTGHRVYRLAADGTLTTVAGTGVAGFAGDGSAAVRAQLANPAGIAVDRAGNLYIGDTSNHLIRKISSGVISSVARAAAATGISVDTFGNVYVADPGAGQILALFSNGPAAAYPILAHDICFGIDGYAYATNGTRVWRVAFAGQSVAVAGGGNTAHGDGGDATAARLNHPSGIALDAAANLYIADRDNHRIRRVAPDGTIATVAGTGEAGVSPDGTSAITAKLNTPSAVAVGPAGVIYIADASNHAVRAIAPDGTLRTLPVDGLTSPSSLLPDPYGNVYVADVDSIREVTAVGSTVVLAGGLRSPQGMALDSSGNFYFAETGTAHVKRIGRDGHTTLIGEGFWSAPRAVAVDNAGNVFVADSGRQQIFRVDLSGNVSTIAGTGMAAFSGDSGSAPGAALNFPWDIAVNPNGTLFVADLANNRIRSLTPGTRPEGSPRTVFTVLNAASLQPGPVAPGMLVEIRGVSLGAWIQVAFDGIAATVLSASDARLIVRVPADIAQRKSTQMQIAINGNVAGEVALAVVDAAPALFADASGQAAATNQDGNPNSAANPAPRGSIVSLYATGEGVTGAPVSVSIGGYPAEVLYAGPIAEYPGILQINARVPAGYVAPGNLAVVIRVGDIASQPGVFLLVN